MASKTRTTRTHLPSRPQRTLARSSLRTAVRDLHVRFDLDTASDQSTNQVDSLNLGHGVTDIGAGNTVKVTDPQPPRGISDVREGKAVQTRLASADNSHDQLSQPRPNKRSQSGKRGTAAESSTCKKSENGRSLSRKSEENTRRSRQADTAVGCNEGKGSTVPLSKGKRSSKKGSSSPAAQAAAKESVLASSDRPFGHPPTGSNTEPCQTPRRDSARSETRAINHVVVTASKSTPGHQVTEKPKASKNTRSAVADENTSPPFGISNKLASPATLSTPCGHVPPQAAAPQTPVLPPTAKMYQGRLPTATEPVRRILSRQAFEARSPQWVWECTGLALSALFLIAVLAAFTLLRNRTITARARALRQAREISTYGTQLHDVTDSSAAL